MTPTRTSTTGDPAGGAPAPDSLIPAAGGRLLTADDVAGLLGVPRTFVYALSRRGSLPTVRIGDRYVRYRAQTIHEWIAGQESTRPEGTP